MCYKSRVAISKMKDIRTRCVKTPDLRAQDSDMSTGFFKHIQLVGSSIDRSVWVPQAGTVRVLGGLRLK